MSHSSLAANTVPIDRGASHEAACAGKLQVLLLMGSGVVAAAQIGKAIISVPIIRSDLALGLDLAGLIVATFATLGAMTGIGAGLVVGRLGAARSLIGGMGVISLGNVIGASAPDQLVLLVARIIEGVGFLAVVVAIPSMLAQLVTREKRDFVMAAWSAYMPIGIMLMLLVAPLLPTIGWRSFWLANSLVTGSCAILLAIHAPSPAIAGDGARGGGALFRGRLDHRPSTELPGTRLRVLRVFVSDLLPRLCAAASAHVGAWRVARRGRSAQRHGLGGQRDRTSFVERPAASWRADLGQRRGSVRILCAFKLCRVWQRASAARHLARRRAGARNRRSCARRTLCGSPARCPKPVRGAVDHRTVAAS